MDIYPVSELPKIRKSLIERLAQGQIGVIPTDTIYGFAADARIDTAVERVLSLKGRETPISCIPHSLEWARQLIASDFRTLFDLNIEQFRGRFTTLWPSCTEQKLAHRCVQTDSLVGIRLPDHWILELAEQAGIPLITTSVNRTGEPPMRCLDTLDPTLVEGIDFLVDELRLTNPPSTIVRCDTSEFQRQARS